MNPTDLAEQLCTAAGMILEDASVAALTTSGDLAERVAQVAQAGERIRVLAAAAVVLAAEPPMI